MWRGGGGGGFDDIYFCQFIIIESQENRTGSILDKAT